MRCIQNGKLKLSLLLLLFLSSCIKTESEKTWHLMTRKGNVWHVDKMVVTAIGLSGEFQSQQTFTDVGDFTFEGDKEADQYRILDFNGEVKLHPDYSLKYGPFSENYEVLGDAFQVGLMEYDVVYQSKKKLNLFVRKETNAYFTQAYDFTFYFECTRK